MAEIKNQYEDFLGLRAGQESWLEEIESEKEGQNDKDVTHPNFPFPAGYTKIDFDHLDRSNFVQMAEDLMSYRKTIQEPYLKHGRKMKELEDKFDVSDGMFRRLLEPRTEPLVNIRRNTDKYETAPYDVVVPNKPYTKGGKVALKSLPPPPMSNDLENQAITRRQRILRRAQANAVHEHDLMIRLMKERTKPRYAWLKGASVTRFHFDLPTQAEEEYKPDGETVEKVQSWLDKYFIIKPVPLLLHVPRHIQQRLEMKFKSPVPMPLVPKIVYNHPYNSDGLLSVEPPPVAKPQPATRLKKSARRREVHVIKGVMVAPPVIHPDIENSFIPGYDLRPIRDLMKILHGTIQPHRFRYVLPFGEFLDNEILFQYQGNLLFATARSPGRVDKNPRLIEEIIEIPDGVPLSSLKFYRSLDNEIVIEEDSRRPKRKKNFINLVSDPLNSNFDARTTVVPSVGSQIIS